MRENYVLMNNILCFQNELKMPVDPVSRDPDTTSNNSSGIYHQ